MNVHSTELMLLGNALRKLRESHGYSQDKFALEVGLGRTYYGRLERGEINASVMTLLKISKSTNTELNKIIPNLLDDTI